MSKDDFKEMTILEQGMIVMQEGNHLTQVKKGDYLLNLYSVGDFFVEVYYSLIKNEIEKIDVITDLSRIDLYIDEKMNPKSIS
ncbi:MAG: hypothetical protein JEY96_14720 [Bacteroidales bacterium]|nr:hypothetical protein [Bacteroidales bacterium]